MEFRLLGPVEARENGRPVPLPGTKPRALLAVLLLHANEVVSSSALIDALWGERPPETAAKVLQTYVSQLRKALGREGAAGSELLVTRPGGYELRVAPDALDLQRFQRLVSEGRRALQEERPREAAAILADALGLWRGPPLGGLRDELFATAELRRLEEARIAALEDRIEADLRCGRARELVPELEALVAQQPLRERPRGQLMLALYRAGRQADALQAYRDARRLLVEELGLEPSLELQRLEKAILVQDASLDSPAASVASRPLGPGRRTPLLIAALVVAGGALGGGLYAALGSSGGSASVPPNSIAAIDPRTNSVVGTLSVGVGPQAVAFGAGSVWVANVRDETVSRIDPASLRLERTIPVGEYPSDVAVGLDAVWVVSAPLGHLVRVDRASDLAGSSTPVPACGGSLAGLAIGDGSIWLACDTAPHVARIDPRTRVAHDFGLSAGLVTSATGSVVPHFSDVAFGDGALWVVDRGRDTVTEIDPATNQPVRQFTVGRDPVALAVGPGSVWVADRGDDAVARIEIAGPGLPGRVQQIPVGRHPVDVTVGSGGVWVANAGNATVSRIDPKSNRVVATIRLGNAPRGIAFGAGRIWVTIGLS